MLVDSHCHLDMILDQSKEQTLQQILERARTNEVGFILNVGVNLTDFPRVLSIAETESFIAASVGIHPNEEAPDDLITLKQYAAHPKVIAIGETGLDYYRSSGDLTWQHERFRHHIRLANELKKPLIIHTRQAREDTLTIMHEENATQCSGVMHCFTESLEMAKAVIDLGFYISFSGIITFKNATEIQEVAKNIPLDRILIETDAPYLAPNPHRGKLNEPSFVRYTAEYIANLRGITFAELAKASTTNFFNLFKGATRPHV